MKALLAVALVAAPVPASAPLAPGSTLYSDSIPTVRFQGDNVAAVIMVADVAPYCGKSDKPGMVIIACSSGNTIVVPNPCLTADADWYARILCHELAHENRWPATHGE